MNIVNLWHHTPHPAQARLAEYLAAAEFPPGSVFLWGISGEPPADLAATRTALERRGYSVAVHQIAPPPAMMDLRAKHERIAALYTQIVPHLAAATALLIEDDVIPLDLAAAPRLARILAAAPPECAMVAAAYRSRTKPDCACAAAREYLLWDTLPTDPIPVRWAGSGLALFRTAAFAAAAPFRVEESPSAALARKFAGWDFCYADDFRRMGFPMLLAPAIRAEHRCQEVLGWCERRGCSLA